MTKRRRRRRGPRWSQGRLAWPRERTPTGWRPVESASNDADVLGCRDSSSDYPRRASPYPYPTSIDTSSSTVHATTLGSSTNAPLSAPIVPNHSYYPPTWNSYDAAPNHGPPMPMPGRAMSAQWYAEPSHLDRVQEEGAPPMAYNHQGMQQFYSGA